MSDIAVVQRDIAEVQKELRLVNRELAKIRKRVPSDPAGFPAWEAEKVPWVARRKALREELAEYQQEREVLKGKAPVTLIQLSEIIDRACAVEDALEKGNGLEAADGLSDLIDLIDWLESEEDRLKEMCK